MSAVDFTRKKVGSLTLGEKLRKIRNDHRIGLAEASKATKIQVKYLEALESGSYEKLPPEVYVRGFLRGYAAFLGIPEDATLRMYDRERSIQKNLGRGEPFRFQPHAPVRFRFDFSSKTAVALLIGLVSVGFFSYLYVEFRSFVSEPRLVVSEPMDKSTVQTGELVVSGETDRRARVSINGVETIVGDDGHFSEHVTLTAGFNAISISSVNRFGKSRSRTISVNADIPEVVSVPVPAPGETVPEKVRLSLRVTEFVTMTVKADGETVFSGRLGPGETKSFEARGEISVSSTKGSAVFVREGTRPEEALSSDEGSAERIFRPTSGLSGTE